MIIALDAQGERIAASPGVEAYCPLCRAPVTAKCGTQVTWHFAHQSVDDCDPWAEPETEWHIGWKEQFPPSWREVVVGEHRADVHTPQGFTLELQHSRLVAVKIRQRELAYGNMAWLLDRSRAATLSDGVVKGVRFQWPRAPLAWTRAHAPLYLDGGDRELLRVTRWQRHTTLADWPRDYFPEPGEDLSDTRRIVWQGYADRVVRSQFVFSLLRPALSTMSPADLRYCWLRHAGPRYQSIPGDLEATLGEAAAWEAIGDLVRASLARRRKPFADFEEVALSCQHEVKALLRRVT